MDPKHELAIHRLADAIKKHVAKDEMPELMDVLDNATYDAIVREERDLANLHPFADYLHKLFEELK